MNLKTNEGTKSEEGKMERIKPNSDWRFNKKS